MAVSSALSPQVLSLQGPFEHVFVHTRGVRIHCVSAGQQSDPCVLLIHDGGGCWADFRRVLQPLAQAGFHAVAVDVRGAGMSDKPPSEYGLRFLAGDMSGVIRQMGHDAAIVCGAGTGAAVAWALAVGYPQCVKALVSVAGGYPADVRSAALRSPVFAVAPAFRAVAIAFPSVLKWWAKRNPVTCSRWWLRAATGPDCDVSALACGVSDAQVREWVLRIDAVDNTVAALARYLRVSWAPAPSKWANVRVRVPVSMVVPDECGGFWRLLARKATARCAGGVGVRVVSFPQCGRSPHMEQPDKFVQLIAQALSTD